MPLRQRASLAVALLMVSTAALAGTPQKSGSEPLIRPSADSPAAAASRGIKNRGARRLISRRPIARAGFPAGMRAIGSRQIGRAVWYQLEGSRTASGERIDDSRATAAHRSLPLLSYARVTNLDNGRSVVVQINDRGPVSHRFIIDLSPRAAAEIGMIRSGVAKVAVQPLALDEPQPAAMSRIVSARAWARGTIVSMRHHSSSRWALPPTGPVAHSVGVPRAAVKPLSAEPPVASAETWKPRPAAARA